MMQGKFFYKYKKESGLTTMRLIKTKIKALEVLEITFTTE